MKITLDDKFSIDKEGYLCYTLKELRDNKDKEGNDLFIVYGYFSNLTSALVKYKELKTDKKFENQIVTITNYIKEMKKQHKIIKKLIDMSDDHED